jgi:hypothetical protein
LLPIFPPFAVDSAVYSPDYIGFLPRKSKSLPRKNIISARKVNFSARKTKSSAKKYDICRGFEGISPEVMEQKPRERLERSYPLPTAPLAHPKGEASLL